MNLLAMFGGKFRPVVAHLIGAGKLTLEDVEAEAINQRYISGFRICLLRCLHKRNGEVAPFGYLLVSQSFLDSVCGLP
jgi:hypothetical protein